MNIKFKYVIIGATFTVAALAYYTDSPIIGATLCASLISGYFGMLAGGLLILHKLSTRMPHDVLEALLNDSCEIHTIETGSSARDPDEISQAVKEFHEMLNERERKAKNGE